MSRIVLMAAVCSALLGAISTNLDAQEARWLRYPVISPDGSTIVFTYRGDLWTVPSEGGKATPLTLHEAYDTSPVWSRDGSKIAFASDRYGNFDIWVMPAEGGEARRLTYHSADDMPTAFASDDSAILFSSERMDSVTNVQFPTGAEPGLSGVQSELYAVSLEGGMPEQVLSTPAIYAVPDANGERIAYSDLKGYEDKWRKHDDSSFARDIWMYHLASGAHTRLTDFGHDDRQPVWGPGDSDLYFLSERSGSFNVWRMGLEELEVGAQRQDEAGLPQGTPAQILEATQITQHEAHPVRFLSVADNGDIAYAYDGDLYVRRADRGGCVKVDVTVAADRRVNATQHIDVASEITEFDVSPDGKEIAFIARGEVFVTSTDHAATRRITDTPEQERSVAFSPDGRSLLYAAERLSDEGTTGSWNLYRTDLTDDDEPNFFNATAFEEKPILEIEAETFQPAWSPDGQEVAYLEERTELKVINLASGATRTIAPGDVNYSYLDGDQWYDWSPDGQHFLVSFMSPGRWSYEAGLVAATGEGKLVNLSRSGYEDWEPRWALDGEAMFWQTDRFGNRNQKGRGEGWDLRLGFFTEKAWDRFHLTEAELEQLKETEEKQDEDEQDEGEDGGKRIKKKGEEDKAEEDEDEIKLPDPVDLDLERFEDRIIRLTTHSSDMGDAQLTPDGEKVLYLAKFEKGYDLWSYAHRKQEVKLLAKLNCERVGALKLDKEGKKAYLLVDRSLRTVDVESGEAKPVEMAAKFELDAAAERDYMFEHVWRQTLKKFHDVDMHGVDWEYYKVEYQKFLPYIDTTRDFAEMLSEMLGELNASHTGSYYLPEPQNADATASLGFFPDPEWSEAGVRILEILDKSPLLGDGSKIEAGTVITAIDGLEIAAGENWYPMLNRKAGELVRLSLEDDSGKTWEEKVKPISLHEERQLLYERWEKTRRTEVDRLSDGRLGYTHLRAMSDTTFREIFEDVFGDAVDKEALVLDTRFNLGGWLDEPITVFLSGEVFMTEAPRGREIGVEPANRWTKPSIIIQNEGNYSDGHCVPAGYRALGLGEIVGMQVPGTCTQVWWETLQDRTLYFGIPEVTILDINGTVMENDHFDPDYEIDNDPRLEAAGRDQQLEKAVEVLLQKLGPVESDG